MRSIERLGIVLLRGVALLAAGSAHAQTSASAPLPWLAGCWEGRAGTRLVEEHWLAPRGGTLLGVSRTTVGDSLVEYEYLRIHARADTLVFAAAPSGQTPAEFRTVSGAADVVRFENLAHDFPQRVIYRRVGSDSVVARIEGRRGGELRGIDFPYRRVACPGASRSP
jgi:hypothetical protein